MCLDDLHLSFKEIRYTNEKRSDLTVDRRLFFSVFRRNRETSNEITGYARITTHKNSMNTCSVVAAGIKLGGSRLDIAIYHAHLFSHPIVDVFLRAEGVGGEC